MRSFVFCMFATFSFFFFNDTATTEIYTLSLHDALPILQADRERGFTFSHDKIRECLSAEVCSSRRRRLHRIIGHVLDRKSTRLNSSHVRISYAVFCLKKKI